MRQFETGATRDAVADKYDYEGFLSPAALSRYARYMHKHRKQADGKLRDSDNWQQGMPADVYMQSAWRHLVALWTLHRAGLDHGPVDSDPDVDIEDAACAIVFNVFGFLHERLRQDEDRDRPIL